MNYEQRGKTRAGYGEKTLEGVSKKLIQEFGRGFSVTNLKLIRQFFLVYSVRIGQTLSGQSGNNQKRQTVSDQLKKMRVSAAQLVKAESLSREFTLSWSHYVLLMGMENKQERNFYEIEASKQNWSMRELKR